MSKSPITDAGLQRAIRSYRQHEIPDEKLIGYNLQKDANLALGLTSVDILPCLVLFFGIPGTGKSISPFDLANSLNRAFGVGFSMLHVKCDKVFTSRSTTRDIIEELGRRVDYIRNNYPTILVFDEIDAFSAPISETKTERAATLTWWLRDYCEDLPDKTFTIGTTNYPLRMDFSVWRRFRSISYFGLTPSDVIAKIIKKNFGMSLTDCREVTKFLIRELDKSNFVPLGSDVAKACEQKKLLHGDLRHISNEKLGKDLADLFPGSPRHFVEKYRETYHDHILRANSQMSWWRKELHRRSESFRRGKKS